MGTPNRNPDTTRLGAGMAIGFVVGTGIGLLFNNWALGMILGVAIGAGFGVGYGQQGKRK